jgi:hypothetical protein
MRRNGIQLVEVMVGMAVVTGPLFMGSQMIHTSSRGAHQVQEHFAARLLLADLLELIQSSPTRQTRDLSSTELEALIDERLAQAPDDLRDRLARELRPFRGHLTARTAAIPGAVPLVRVTVAVSWGKATVRLSRTWREVAL